MSEVALNQKTAPSPEVVTLADCSPAQRIEQRYLAAVAGLIEDAVENQSLPILVDVLAWTMGKVIVGYGTPEVPGDFMRRLGGYICDLAERQRAQAEAKQAQKAGLKPH